MLGDAKAPLDVIAFTAISVGLIGVGTCDMHPTERIAFALTNRRESELRDPLLRLLPLGLGLLYLGKQVSGIEHLPIFWNFP